MKRTGILAFSLLAACARQQPLPDPGPCARLPDGVYEWGQIGIGTCLAAPTDLELLDGGSVLAVSNANAYADFSGGSVLLLDVAALDVSLGRNPVDTLAITAVDRPSYAGDMALASDRGLLLVADRFSAEARTRESADHVGLLDVTDPRAPVAAKRAPDGGSEVTVGSDPAAVHYARTAGVAFVLNRTGHSVSLVDLSVDPVEVVGPGGDGRLVASAFEDVDASGSRAGFAQLQAEDAEEPVSVAWSMRWSIGALRAWVPTLGGLRRINGNGEALWERSALDLDLDVEADGEGIVTEVTDPSFFLEEDTTSVAARLVFVNDGGAELRAAVAGAGLVDWAFEAAPLLSAREGAWDATLSGPQLLRNGGLTWLIYAGADASGGGIGAATSGDGVSFARASTGPVLTIDGETPRDPVVVRDTDIDRWRMFFVTEVGVRQAESDDLTSWTVRPEIIASADAHGPEIGLWNGLWHLVYTEAEAGAWVVRHLESVDGYAWTDRGAPFALDADEATAAVAPTLALQAWPDESFTLTDSGGDVFPLSLAPGEAVESPQGGWTALVTVGHTLDPSELDAESVSWGGELDGDGVVSVTDKDGSTWIGSDTGRVWVTAASAEADSVGRATAWATGAGGNVLLFARTVGDVTTIARATSPDGVVWTVGGDVLGLGDSWESVSVEPGSVEQLDDGTLRLWYAASDGSRWRVGLAESVDGGSTFTRVTGAVEAWQFNGGEPGDWDDSGARDPWALTDDAGVTHLWYSGFDGDRWRVGHASRSSDTAAFASAAGVDDVPRAILSGGGGFGYAGVERPVVSPADDGGYRIVYTGIDAGTRRVGAAVSRAGEPTLVHLERNFPTLADTWGFVSVPASDEDAISLDLQVDGNELSGLGCGALAADEVAGMLYVGCKLAPWIYVLDVRDDSVVGDPDLNYLDVETVLVVETSTIFGGSSASGPRDLMVDAARGWLWATIDEPEALVAVDVSGVVDDDDADVQRDVVATMLPLARSGSRDRGADTRSFVGPGRIALHPDGRHLFVTNFNANSVSVLDLATGVPATQIAEIDAVGENPYAVAISPDGTRAFVANYTGELVDGAASGTIVVLDADPASPNFLRPLTWIVNR